MELTEIDLTILWTAFLISTGGVIVTLLVSVLITIPLDKILHRRGARR